MRPIKYNQILVNRKGVVYSSEHEYQFSFHNFIDKDVIITISYLEPDNYYFWGIHDD